MAAEYSVYQLMRRKKHKQQWQSKNKENNNYSREVIFLAQEPWLAIRSLSWCYHSDKVKS